jgi:hypothetical protein
VLDGQPAGDLHGEVLDRSVDELLCRGVEHGLPPPLPPPWTPTVCRMRRSLSLDMSSMGEERGRKGRNGCGERGEGAERERESEERRGRIVCGPPV